MSLVSIPSIPPVPEPLGANRDQVVALADELLRASAGFDDYDTFAAEQLRAELWTGDAATAYQERVRQASKDAATVSLSLRAGAKALWAYADALESLKYRYDSLAEWRGSIVDSVSYLRRWANQVNEIDLPSVRDYASDVRLSVTRYTVDESSYRVALDAANSDLVTALRFYMTVQQARVMAWSGDAADAIFSRPGAPGTGSTPEQVAAWWDALSEAERLDALAASPDLIGSADGLPASVRDNANRMLLERDLEELELAERVGILSDEQTATKDNILAAAKALEECSNVTLDTTIDPITLQPIPSFLLLYQPAAFNNDGAIAIAIGDPDTADNVSVSVPGIRTEGTSAPQYARDARNLYESARLADQYSTTATIAWIGYDSPSGWDPTDIGHTVTESQAIEGGEALSRYVTGLQVAREDNPPHMTVIGHSYGSTTTAHAATDHGLDADDVVLIGSPGAGDGVDNASDLGVPQVWAGNASRDAVAYLADDGWINAGTFGGMGLGNDVAEDDFGALRFQAEDETRWGSIINFSDHMKYYERGTESCINLGEIVVGDYEDVTLAGHVHDPMFDGPQDPEWDREPTPQLDLDEMRSNPDL